MQRKPVLIADRASVVRKIVKDHLRGVGKHGIARSLNESGVPPFGRAAHWHRSYIDKILNGASPGSLPVQEPRKFALNINLATAAGLGITMPESLAVRADRVFR